MSPRWIWQPTPAQIERTNAWRFLRRLGLNSREEFLRYSTHHLEEFWAEMVNETGIRWSHPFERVLDTSRGVEWAEWFIGGKLNIADNCLDRYKDSPRIAILWESEEHGPREITFAQLHDQTCRLAHPLPAMGLREGDPVAL